MTADHFKDVVAGDDAAVTTHRDEIEKELSRMDPAVWKDIEHLNKDQFNKTNAMLEKHFGQCIVLDDKDPNGYRIESYHGQSTVADPLEQAALDAGFTVGTSSIAATAASTGSIDKALLLAGGAAMAYQWLTGGETSEQRAEEQRQADNVNGELGNKAVVTEADLAQAQASLASIHGNTPDAQFARARATAALERVQAMLATAKLAADQGLSGDLAQKYGTPDRLMAAMEQWKKDHPNEPFQL